MNNFTKEYIKECDYESIQGLRKQGLKNFDFYIERFNVKGNRYNEIKVMTLSGNYESVGRLGGELYLPTGDNLDDEIVKICSKIEKFHEYSISFYYNKGMPNNTNCHCQLERWSKSGKALWISEINPNPLIAKIILLKRLIKGDLDNVVF